MLHCQTFFFTAHFSLHPNQAMGSSYESSDLSMILMIARNTYHSRYCAGVAIPSSVLQTSQTFFSLAVKFTDAFAFEGRKKGKSETIEKFQP